MTIVSSGTVPAATITKTTNTENAPKSAALVIDNSLNNGNGIEIYSAESGADETISGLLYVSQASGTFKRPLIYMKSEAESIWGGAADIRIDAKNPDIEFKETDISSCGTVSSGACGKWEIAVNSDVFQINRSEGSQRNGTPRLQCRAAHLHSSQRDKRTAGANSSAAIQTSGSREEVI